MRIAYDPQIFSAQTYGGISRYFSEIASRLAKDVGLQVSIIAPMYINAYLENLSKDLVSGFRPPLSDHFLLYQRALGMLIGDWMLRAFSPDIVHETYYFPYRLGPRRARRVLTIYDMIHEKIPVSFPPADKTSRFKKIAAERADHVICISESTRRDAIEILGLRPEKVSVVYLGYDLMKAPEADMPNADLSTNEPFLLYVGARGGYKNFLRLLQAYATSPPLRTGYRLICFGGKAFCTKELQMMRDLDLNGDRVIHQTGNDRSLAGFYRQASAFVYPSLYEGFGIPPLEAMAHDCPVVCSNTSSIPEVVGDAGEYFQPEDVDSMRAAIERVVGSSEYRKTLIAKGRERLKLFSWDRCARETYNIYQKLI